MEIKGQMTVDKNEAVEAVRAGGEERVKKLETEKAELLEERREIKEENLALMTEIDALKESVAKLKGEVVKLKDDIEGRNLMI